jgi:hypothetical protein
MNFSVLREMEPNYAAFLFLPIFPLAHLAIASASCLRAAALITLFLGRPFLNITR